jgi:hypothetical protein
MKAEVSLSVDGFGSVIKRTFRPEETAKRLNTNVTAGLNSSYVIRGQGQYEWEPPRGPAIVLRPEQIDFP